MTDLKGFWKKLVHPNSVSIFQKLLEDYPVLIKITASRKTKYGDFKSFSDNRIDQISINGDLKQDAFMLTLIHEFGHKRTIDIYGRRTKAHGLEWKESMSHLMGLFQNIGVWDLELELQILRYENNWRAVTIDMPGIYKRISELEDNQKVCLDDIDENARFQMSDGRVFIKGNQLRRYFICKSEEGVSYKVHPNLFVSPLDN